MNMNKGRESESTGNVGYVSCSGLITIAVASATATISDQLGDSPLVYSLALPAVKLRFTESKKVHAFNSE